MTNQDSKSGAGSPSQDPTLPKPTQITRIASGAAGLLQEAIAAVPAVKYALGVGGIAAVISLVAGFLDLRVAVVGIPIIFIFMVILVVFSKLAADSPNLRSAVTGLVRFSSLMFAVAIVLFLVTFFVREDVLHKWGLNSFNELFGFNPASSNKDTTRTN